MRDLKEELEDYDLLAEEEGGRRPRPEGDREGGRGRDRDRNRRN